MIHKILTNTGDENRQLPGPHQNKLPVGLSLVTYTRSSHGFATRMQKTRRGASIEVRSLHKAKESSPKPKETRQVISLLDHVVRTHVLVIYY